MDLDKKEENLFHVEVRRGVYLISIDNRGPTENGMSLSPGNPTGNCYLVIGEERALLFDLAADHPDIRSYAERLAAKPVMLALSHGHFDHTFRLDQFREVWMHPADEPLAQNGGFGTPPVNPFPEIHPLRDGDVIDLGGGRILDVIHIPGHTPGSILLLDRQTKTLLSGDTCARRLLYGSIEFVPTNIFCASLRRLQERDYEVVYSAHDRCALPKSQPEHMIRLITEELPHTDKTWSYRGFEEMAWLVYSDVYLLDYFDMVVPIKYMKSLNA